MRYESEHKPKIRERIVKEAAKAIRAKGPLQVSVAGVMSKAGLTHGGFYAHFASKDALIEAAIQQMFNQVMLRWEKNNQGLTAQQQLAGYIDFYLSPWHRDNRAQGCPVSALASETPRMSAPCQAEFARGIERIRGMIIRQLTEMGVEDPQTTAVSVSSELMGSLSLARCEPDREASDALLESAKKALMARLNLPEE
ncbi:TetR/AcrR family transcriptional regulator [Rahnella sp. Lac-M11]|jgi:TetR/AcrR family transcriptional repressor of nem operon|uniref:TetR/AcrR family transcriptional regulator n=1 Tax=Rahnella contaminans TaxID=2703882 RepID=A0A6M2B1M3_9GAMM|nr:MULTISPECIES: TetR/AcrR family transcriptional regulator [Rahnella]KAB8307073.1 TetR/AcrR family transcriptional regulator [Rouxiella chamberiensis]MBU9820552.1 TetR/AcrR family transcriptional regulator [Rahnella sp. BCC 1045]NGX86371.1 TetR/AcrR family transcriptional regulator [Rahnella contaminans]